MAATGRRAFTLVELLVVITILTVLVCLLLPALAATWQVVHAVQCRSNLHTIYAALCMRQADANTVFFSNGPGWNAPLLPYVENRPEVFLCPSSLGPLDTSTGTVTQTAGGSGAPGQGSGGGGPASSSPPPQLAGFDISFNVFSNPQFTHLDWNVSFNSIWCRTTANYNANDPNMPPAYTWRYQIEDRGFLVEETGNWAYADDYADIDVAVTYSSNFGTPTFIKIIQAKNGSQARRFDMLINGTLAVHNIDAHQGMVIDLRPAQTSQGAASPGAPGAPGTTGQGTTTTVTYTFVPCDYGMSVGSYSVPNLDVERIDPKLFLVLDYPKPLADYNVSGADYGQWDKYFITDPTAWKTTYDPNNTGANWAQYQALRHFGMANVLFCDGHVDTLPGQYATTDDQKTMRYLYIDNPLWVYGQPVHSN